MTPYPPQQLDGADLTPPTAPDLVAHLADILAEAAEDHGTHDHHGQAADVIAWLTEEGWLLSEGKVTDALIDAGTDLEQLRNLLGLQGDEQPCGVRNSGGPDQTEPALTCLLPASHVADGRWHQGLGGTWSL